ncbi:MAG: hypothetical protein LBI84_02745 [Propionibacteriaceae bacterium]|nr:hypothetical protein [Propionibacteriaceae bacterium]
MAAVSALTGCSQLSSPASVTESTADPIAVSHIDDILASADASGMDDFQRAVIEQARETGKISEENWKQANYNMLECVSAAAPDMVCQVTYDGARVDNECHFPNSSEMTEGDLKNWSLIIRDCQMRHAGDVNSLYAYLYGGPEQRDPEYLPRQIWQCLLDRQGLPETVTFEQFYADFDNGAVSYGPDQGGLFKDCWDKAMAG